MPCQHHITHDVHRGRVASPLGGKMSAYHQRRPENSILYQVMRDNYRTWRYQRELSYPLSRVPDYITREMERYLECGVLACGFARAYCRACQKDLIIPYSCKGKAVCDTCTRRRMFDTTLYLTEQILPAVSMRQFVLSYPKRLRYFIHKDEALLDAVLKIFLDEVRKVLVAHSPGAPRDAKMGSVTFIQRFGSELNPILTT